MKYKLIVLLILIYLQSKSQNWIPLGVGLNDEVRCLASDSITNNLFVGGNFTYSGNMPLNQIAVWNGQNWDSMASGGSLQTPVRAMNMFNNKLYSSGIFCGNINNFWGSWNGLNWDSCSVNVDGPPITYFNDSNEMIFGGTFQNINSQPCCGLAIYDGISINCLNINFIYPFNQVFALTKFNNELIIGGYFQIGSIMNLAGYDGQSVHYLGSNIYGQFSYINTLCVFNNELYIGGSFSTIDGNAGNNIMKWDGNQLSSVSIGSNGPVWDMEVYNGSLFAVGAFDSIGGVSASKIAKWDGLQWHNLTNDVFNNNINCIHFFNNKLYIGGGFTIIGSDSVMHISEYTGPLNSPSMKSELFFNVTPTVVFSNFKVVTNNVHGKLKMYDLIGDEIKIISKNENDNIDVSLLNPGIYLLTYQVGSSIATRKIVKL
jgi:hypothetical protein